MIVPERRVLRPGTGIIRNGPGGAVEWAEAAAFTATGRNKSGKEVS